jgi:starch synthase
MSPPTRESSSPDPSVLIIGSEALPFAKTGGLADVLGALPPALARLGWRVTLALPRYRDIDDGTLVERFSMTIGGSVFDGGFYEASLANGVHALLIDSPEMYGREALYGVGNTDYPDNARRFALLARATLEFVGRRGAGPAVVHAHDWQAGLAPVYLKTLYASHPILGESPSVLTIHNLAYQGLFEPDWLPRLDLPWSLYATDQMEYWGRISFLKGGINNAEIITTVSPRYAQEIQTPALGFGFDGILRARSADLVGILNGIDVDEWDPSRDPVLPQPYTSDDLSGKAAAKRELLSRMRLPADHRAMARPLVGMVSRMVDQKGFDLIAAVVEDLLALDAAWVVLGTGETRYEDLWRLLAQRYPARVAAHLGFDEALAHLIEAGADTFLMPSRFEPCGLNQMYSLRYGTVPIVREVGGLADTVRDYSRDDPTSTGFVFREYTGAALLECVKRALALFANPPRWRTLQLAGMRQDHSWDRSAREYVKIYDRAMRKVQSA